MTAVATEGWSQGEVDRLSGGSQDLESSVSGPARMNGNPRPEADDMRALIANVGSAANYGESLCNCSSQLQFTH